MHLNNLNLFYPLLIKDGIEIIALSIICYWFLRWLATDKQQPLTVYFYAYAFFWGVCCLAQLNTLVSLLENTFATVLMLFMLVHQKTLQKNFISLCKIKPAQKAQSDWLQEIIRFCLQAETDLFFLVEHKQSLHDLVTINTPMQAQINCELLQFLHHSSDLDPRKYIIIDTHGTLHGLHVQWQKPLALTDLDENELAKASYYLMQTDAFMLHYNYEQRLFAIVMRDTIYNNLTTAQVLQSVTHYLADQPKKGNHEKSYSCKNKRQPHA